MSTFQWRGEVLPFPPGFEGLAVDRWCLRLGAIAQRMEQAGPELPLVLDAQGSPLAPAEVALIQEFGFLGLHHFEAFRAWSLLAWAQHLGETSEQVAQRMSGPRAEQRAGTDPESFEYFVQVQEAMVAAREQGRDAAAVLAQFGLSATDFTNLGAYWNRQMQSRSMSYGEMYGRYSAKYRAMYGGTAG